MRGEHEASEASRSRPTVPRNRPHRFVEHLIATLLAAVAVSTLAACTGDPAPVGTVPDGSPVTSAGVTATPEPTRPVEAATPESAIQFTRYFWDLYNYAYQTYDTAPLKAIARPTCSFCTTITGDVEKISAAGTRIDGHIVRVVESTSPPVKIATGTLVIATIAQDPGTALGSNGKTTKLPGFENRRSTVSLTWEGHWSIDAISIKSGSS